MHPWLVLSHSLYIYAHKGVHNAHEEEYTFFFFFPEGAQQAG